MLRELDLSIDHLRARQSFKWNRYSRDVLPAWVADMDYAVAPEIQAAISRVVDAQDYGYAMRDGEYGDKHIASAFSTRMKAAFGWVVDPALVQPIADLIQAMHGTILAYSEAGEGVILQTPAYPPFRNVITGTSRRLLDNPLLDAGDRFVVDVPSLRSAAQSGRARMIMLCNPQNPTGRALTHDELLSIGQAAVENDLIVVSDEIHSELVFPPFKHIPMATLGPEIAERTVTITSATKAYNIAGLRCAVMHFGSEKLRDRFYRRIPPGLLGHPGIIGADATVAAWLHGQPWLDKVRDKLRSNRDHVADFFAGELPAIKFYKPQATYFAWLDCTRLATGGSPYRFFLDRGVGLNDGTDFSPRTGACVRLNFATSRDILNSVLQRMANAVRRNDGAVA